MDLEKAFMKFFRINAIIDLKQMNENMFTPLNHHSLMYLDLIYYNEQTTISSLSQMLNVAKPAVTQKVNELVKKGLVEKKQSAEDKRVYFLSITKKAEEEYEFSFKPYIAAYEELTKNFNSDEIETCAKVFSEFSNYLEKQL